MGLIIRPKSKLRALQARLFNWENLKLTFRSEPIEIQFENILQVYFHSGKGDPHWIAYSSDGLTTFIYFYPDEINDMQALQEFVEQHPIKLVQSKFAHIKGLMLTHFKLHYKYGAFYEKFILGFLAFTFMFFQFKYFGSLMIQKYQFLIKSSCNTHCAEMLWSSSVWGFYGLLMILAPIIPLFFYQRIYKSVLRSKDVQTVNSTMFTLVILTILFVFSAIPAIPNVVVSASKYSKIIVAYADGTLETKLSQKIEMASKREFQGDIDEVEEYDMYEDQHEE